MEYLPETIALSIFVLVMGFIAWRGRNSTLEKLPMLPGEEILFEESDRQVHLEGGRPRILPGCRIRVTTHRIIVAQRVRGRDTHHLQQVFHVPSSGETSLSGVYVTTHLQPEQIQLDADLNQVRLPLGDSALTAMTTVVIPTEQLPRYAARLRP